MLKPPDFTATPGPRLRTQRDFLAGLQCHKQLWWRVHEPEATELVSDAHAHSLKQEHRHIAVLARDQVQGGTPIDFRFQSTGARVAATRSALLGIIRPSTTPLSRSMELWCTWTSSNALAAAGP